MSPDLAAASTAAHTAAVRLWRTWYAMEDSRPTADTPEYDAWAHVCALIHERASIAGRRADALAVLAVLAIVAPTQSAD